MVTRPCMHASQTDITSVPPSCAGPALTHREWLAAMQTGDVTRVRTHTGDMMPPARVTNDTPRYLFIGKLKFRRGDGWQVKSNASRCYRMRLRLVRDEKELL